MVLLELKKIKRTGLIPAFLMGGLLAAGVPVLNMFFRSDIYLSLPDTPLQILLKSNWQMMAMLNILLIISGACLMYYSEFLDNAIQKMKSLPIKESNIYLLESRYSSEYVFNRACYRSRHFVIHYFLLV